MDDEEFPEINTGNGIDRNFAATTNDRLKKTVLELRSLKEVIATLGKAIIDLNEKNGKLQKQIFWLTVVAVALTAVQAVETIKFIFD